MPVYIWIHSTLTGFWINSSATSILHQNDGDLAIESSWSVYIHFLLLRAGIGRGNVEPEDARRLRVPCLLQLDGQATRQVEGPGAQRGGIEQPLERSAAGGPVLRELLDGVVFVVVIAHTDVLHAWMDDAGNVGALVETVVPRLKETGAQFCEAPVLQVLTLSVRR